MPSLHATIIPSNLFARMLICCTVMKGSFSNTMPWICRPFRTCQSGFVFWLMKKFTMALFTCIFALGGAPIGAITGAIKGHTTETGFSRGFGIGAVAGAIAGVQLMELITSGEPFSKVALIRSLVNGKIFMEWVSPAMLKAYQWQVSASETSLRDFSDIFDIHTFTGLSQDTIKDLPVYDFYNGETTNSCSKLVVQFVCRIWRMENLQGCFPGVDISSTFTASINGSSGRELPDLQTGRLADDNPMMMKPAIREFPVLRKCKKLEHKLGEQEMCAGISICLMGHDSTKK